MAALWRRVPVVVMEPNAVPGFTNRVIGRFVSRALLSFSETASYFPRGKSETTGLPVREEFFQIPSKARAEPLSILITGGSQGSRTINQAARQSWPLFREAGVRVRVVHQTGPAGFEQLRDEFSRSGLDGEIVPFLTDMSSAFAAADLVVCRAGAGTLSELAASGRPAILVPFPFAADDHQTRNAEAMERGGAAKLVRDADLNGDSLYRAITALAGDAGALDSMSKAVRQFAKPGAAGRAADILEDISH